MRFIVVANEVFQNPLGQKKLFSKTISSAKKKNICQFFWSKIIPSTSSGMTIDKITLFRQLMRSG